MKKEYKAIYNEDKFINYIEKVVDLTIYRNGKLFKKEVKLFEF